MIVRMSVLEKFQEKIIQ